MKTAPSPRAENRPSTWRVWLAATRPRTLTLAIAPVLAGTALAWAESAAPYWTPAILALLSAMLIQIGTNLHNDVADFERGNDREDRLGPLRVTAAGWLSARQVRNAAYAAFGSALLLGIYLVILGGWVILAIGCASLLAARAYSGGKRPISHTPFGELFACIFFGLLAVIGCYWLQASRISPAALFTGAIIGFPAAAVLLVNNLRDIATDLRAGRRTLAAFLGNHGARRAYALLMLLPYAGIPVLAFMVGKGTWLALVALPFCVLLLKRVLQGASGTALNAILAGTAQCAFGFAVLLSLGFRL